MLCWHRSSVNIFLFVLNTNCLSLSCSFNTILSKSLPRNNHHIVAQRAKETSQSLIKQTVMMMWKCYTKSYSTYNMFINDFWCYFFSVLLLFFFVVVDVLFPKHLQHLSVEWARLKRVSAQRRMILQKMLKQNIKETKTVAQIRKIKYSKC